MRARAPVVLVFTAAALLPPTFGQNYLISTVGGRPVTPADLLPGAPVGDGGPYWEALFKVPWRLTMDRAGNIYVADRTEYRIRRIGTDGIVTTVAGTGVAGFSGDGGPARAAQLSEPAGVAIDASGNLYISDSLNHRIRKVDTKGIISTIAGNGTQGYAGDGGPAASAVLSFPDHLYFDPQGNLFLIDDQRVRKITPDGNISLFAGNGVNLGCCLPETISDGDGGPAIAALLHQPSGIAFDLKGNVLIAEVYGDRIRKVGSGGIISTLAANVCTPNGLTLDPEGNLYTANNGCFEIAKIAPDATQTVIAGTMPHATPVCGVPLGIDGPAQFAQPMGGDVLWDPAGRLLIGADYNTGYAGSGFVQSLTPANIFPAWVVNLATGCRSFPAPGELVSIRWLDMGPNTVTAAAPGASGTYPTQLSGTTVLFDGIPAPILYVDQTEIRTMIPSRTANQIGTVLQVVYEGMSSNSPVLSNSIVLQSHVTSPALFTLRGGSGPAAALNQDFTPNSSTHPAQKGSVVMLYGTGGGAFASSIQDGEVPQSPIPLASPVAATVGGIPAAVEYAGTAPGLVAGVMQVNVQVPQAAPSGNIAVVLTVQGVPSQAAVTIAVR
jgi:uncharacterized protein (TIGR03437 family)